MTLSTSLYTVFVIVILTLIYFAQAQGQAQWGSPNSTINYGSRTIVPVLIFTPSDELVSVTQSCGGITKDVTQTISTNQFAYFHLPLFYTSSCTYSSPDLADLAPISIDVTLFGRVITFISPMTTIPATEYLAGSIVTFKYVIGAPDFLPRRVQFSCSNLTLSPVSFWAFPNIDIQVNIPDTFYGNYCSFIFTGFDGPAEVANTAVISVVQPSPPPPPPPQTQTLVFVQVPDIIQIDEIFNVEISSNGTFPPGSFANLGLFCNGVLSPAFEWYSVTLNQTVPLVLPAISISVGIGCYLEALSTESHFIDSLPYPVLIKLNIASPFGGDLVEITDQEAAVFLSTVTIAPQSWYNFGKDIIQNLLP